MFGFSLGLLRSLWRNLILSLLAIGVSFLLGLVLSWPANLFLHTEATGYKLGNHQSIDTAKLEAYERSRLGIVLFFTAVGALAAQVVFVLDACGKASGSRGQAEEPVRPTL